jgi:hypothetical protein
MNMFWLLDRLARNGDGLRPEIAGMRFGMRSTSYDPSPLRMAQSCRFHAGGSGREYASHGNPAGPPRGTSPIRED